MRIATTVLTLVVTASLTAAEPIRLPAPSAGAINGRVALMFWPASSTTGGTLNNLLPVDGCRVVLAPWTDFTAERSYDCGTWIQPAAGRYQAWLEVGGARVSPIAATVNYAPIPFEGKGQQIVMPVGAGGRVALASEIPLPADSEVSLINFDSCCTARLGVPFTRRLADPTSLRGGVMMPAGRVFPGIFDRRSRDAIAIARPVLVAAGNTIVATPHPPNPGTSDVFLSLGRPRIRSTREADSVALTLDGKKPEMLFDGDDRIYAAWFGIKATTASLAMSSETLRLPSRTLKLSPGRVTTVREELLTRPSVDVSLLTLPDAFGNEPLHVDVVSPSGTVALRSAPIQPGVETRIEALPAEPVDVVLRVGPWRFRQSVDLTVGVDERVVFDPRPIVVRGEVFYGRDRAANAEVAFEADEGLVRGIADDEGRYRITLWRGGDAWTAQVTIPDRPGPPFVDGFLQINNSLVLDFKVPRTEFSVRVVDAETGVGIDGASVSAANIFRHRSEEEMTLMQSAIADNEGRARLAPLREGRIEIRAQAEGYVTSEKVDGVVRAADSKGTFDVRMQRVGETVALKLRTNDGRAVAAAEVRAVREPHGVQRPLWSGRSDEYGVVRVPRSTDGAALLIRCLDTASAVRTFDATNGEVIVLQPPAPPVSVSVPSRTRMAIWVDGVRVTGPAVTFLTWSSEASDAEGTWWAKNLPARTLRLLAWQRAPVMEIAAGMHDVNATTIPYPWPSTIAVDPLD